MKDKSLTTVIAADHYPFRHRVWIGGDEFAHLTVEWIRTSAPAVETPPTVRAMVRATPQQQPTAFLVFERVPEPQYGFRRLSCRWRPLTADLTADQRIRWRDHSLPTVDNHRYPHVDRLLNDTASAHGIA